MRTFKPTVRVRALAFALPVLLAACGDSAPVEPPPAAPRWIEVVPDSLHLTYIGERVRMQARIQRDPKLYEGREVKWSSTDTSVITVDAEGEVTALANGEAGLAAELIGFHDTAYVRVRQLAAELEVLGGHQRGGAGLPLLEPVGVRATDAGGTLLLWSLPVDFDASADGGRLSRRRWYTHRDGEAWAEWTLGPGAGAQTLSVTAWRGTASAEIGAVAIEADSVVAALQVREGDGQGAPSGTPLEEPVVVAAVDSLGRRVPNASVRFQPAAGHGSAEPAEAVTDSAGLASTIWTMGGAVGRQTMFVSVARGASVEVTATAQSDEGVCPRTPAVAEEIVRRAGVASCAEVTDVHLAEIGRLKLNGRGIRRLRSGDFAGLTDMRHLELQFNELSVLPPGIFDGLTALNDLKLHVNKLEALSPDVFDGLAQLWRLALEDNELTELPPGVFDGLARMRDLDLRNNALEALPPDIFAGLEDLNSLDLRNNLLGPLPAGIFDGLARMRHLFLDGNRIAALPANAFADMAQLRELGLAGVGLKALPPGIFDGLTELVDLNLFYNDLTELPPGVFNDLGSLASLQLEFNGLAALPPGTFDGLGKLEILDLDRNRLTELRPGVFAELAHLRKLYFRDNALAELPPGVLAGLRRLEVFHAHFNPGSPFPFRVELARLDAGWLVPGPARVAMRVPGGAPFGFRMPVSVQRGTGSAAWLEVAVGDTVSAPLMVERSSGSGGAVHLSFGQPPGLPVDYRGLEVVAGPPAALFAETDNRPPIVAELVPAYWLQAGGEAEPLSLGPHFRDLDGDSLVYAVEASDGMVVQGRVRSGVVWMEPVGEGEAMLEVTASDPEGLAASQRVAIEVAPATNPDRFDIHLVFSPGFSERHRELARQAADRWEEVVVGDLPDVPIDGYLSSDCGLQFDGRRLRLAGTIDDLVVYLDRKSELGAPATAATCGVRETSGLSFLGGARYPPDFFTTSFPEWEDWFYRATLHEIGHVLDIGSFGGMRKTVPNTSPPDHYFPGPLATAAFNAVGGGAYVGGKVPLENAAPRPISNRTHWRWSVFGGEVMDFAATAALVSPITVQALADLGYVVDVSKADPFTLRWPVSGAPPADAVADEVKAEPFEFVDEVVQVPVMVVDSTGKVVRVIRN